MEEDEEEDPDEDPKKEPIEQLVLEPNNIDGFALHLNPQPEGNMNVWLIEDDDDVELEEDGVGDDDEKIEMDDEDNGGNNDEGDAKETEFAPPVVSIVDANDEPMPPIIQFGEDPPIHAASAPRSDDPYVIARDAAITTKDDNDRAIRGNPSRADGFRGNNGDQGGAPPIRECTDTSFMKCNPITFLGVEGAIKLCDWFEKTKSVFSISECAERNKTEMKTMMKEEFCPPEEIQRMEVELWNLRVKDLNISAYTQRFNELVLLCPEVVPSEMKKEEAYIHKFPDNIKWETTSSKPIVLNDTVRMAHTLME
ncbi:reverse transcriptase domain-containing protein [Tanacetum coccineum]